MTRKTEASYLRIVCDDHGEVVNEEVYCQHDVEEVITRVSKAHRPTYGANCHAMLTIFLDEERERTERYFPPISAVIE